LAANHNVHHPHVVAVLPACLALQEAAAEEEFGAKLTPINNRRDFEALIQGNRPVVVDFMAPWCGKCRMIAPFVDELAEKHPNMVS
jgi:thiol-disulfide isomerase/thioredoxin